VWVANRFADTLTRIDARRGRRIGRPVALGADSEPFAVSVHGHSAWATLLRAGQLARVTF
jgi:hypothetical protein